MAGPNVTDLKKQAKEILGPLKGWKHDCHAASVRLVKMGFGTRVARGWCDGVRGQHSWVVMGDDCYSHKALIVDPTLWSYREDVKGIYVGNVQKYGHIPHGHGSIWEAGKPTRGNGPIIKLTPEKELSAAADVFLDLLGPLDFQGWNQLANSPVGGWPAKEILTAIYQTKDIRSTIPIDIVGMVTDLNPHGLYMRENGKKS